MQTAVESKLTVSINGKEFDARKGETILQLAKRNDINIPTLCNHADLCESGNCRMCVVEVEGQRVLQASCTTPVAERMVIRTNTRKVRKTRQMIIELLLAEHVGDCQTCKRNTNCELQDLAAEYGIEEVRFGKSQEKRYEVDTRTPIVRDNDKCILCRRCTQVCEEIQGVEAIKPMGRGKDTDIGCLFGLPLDETTCVFCGQCINRCPTGALTERDATKEVWKAIDDPTKHVVVQTAPAIRAALAEEFDIPPGERVTGKMASALKMIGFDTVFDTDFTADLTIIEEGTELLTRLKKALVEKSQVALPMFTSCSPGWINYIEHYYPDLLPNLSTCKSPQQMFGALIKTYYAQKKGVDPKNIVSVSVMPCTAKKFEADRPEMYDSGYKDVDHVLTTRELARMIKQAGIDLMDLQDSEFDDPMGISTGAAVIFGATGGVMEAAIRTAYELVTGREVPFANLDIRPVRGMEGIREASLTITDPLPEWSFLNGAEVKVAIAHSLTKARMLMDKVRAGEATYHFIEVMACPGGCLGGGGQPIPTSPEIREKRAQAIYTEDGAMKLRKSHENPAVKVLYEEFLKEPNGHKSHELLHTKYTPKDTW
ncbi:MAG: hypothetical protein A2Y25_09270 [Candidatus Melainabacteria bacterium GWF2_37_15]|nr:MAG: hypothetical protein A2Y25_09270 [Candidatus Melainabacteria bacterium GWF2_37_15]